MSVFGPLRGKLLLLAALAVTAGLVLAACGGGGSSSSSSSESSESSESGGGETNSALENASYLGEGESGLGIRPAGGKRQEEAEGLGTEAGEEKEQVELPTVKVGIINFLNGIESSDRLADTTVFAAAQLGWSANVCDGKGTPSQFVACQITPVLQKAKSAGVPVIQVGGGAVPTGELSGNYGPNEAKAGEILTEALFEELDGLEEEPVEIAVHNFPAKWGSVRTEQLEKAVEEQSKIKIADNTVTDAANLVPFTRSTVTTQITQNPDLKAFWFTFDTTGQVGGQVIASKYAGKEFPERPLVATFHGDLSTLSLMEQGAIDMTSEVNYDAAVWEGIDGIAQELAREEPMSKENQPSYPGIGDPFTYQIVTKEDLPPAGEYVAPKYDVPSYFIAKWKAEYGV